ncbi:MAG TPA: hypothetical protein VGF85_09185 [Opitutaceae bacterium]|jgi:hypothetical protein
MNISPQEAAIALRDIEVSRAAMRRAVRDHRGHIYLWIWGSTWAALSVLEAFHLRHLLVYTNTISIAGLVASVVFIFVQRRQVRSTFDKRFLGVCGALLGFGYLVWPTLLGQPQGFQAGFGYSILIWMQVYIVAGIWFDNYWLWIGIVMTVLILAAFLLFPAYFWIGPLIGGLTLLVTGFHVRNASCA